MELSEMEKCEKINMIRNKIHCVSSFSTNLKKSFLGGGAFFKVYLPGSRSQLIMNLNSCKKKRAFIAKNNNLVELFFCIPPCSESDQGETGTAF